MKIKWNSYSQKYLFSHFLKAKTFSVAKILNCFSKRLQVPYELGLKEVCDGKLKHTRILYNV